MLRSYILIFLRDIKSTKTFTIVNILGLSLGICFSGLIYIFLKSEKSFDQFHLHKNRIFRIESNIYDQDAVGEDKFRGFSELSDPLINAIRNQVPEIQNSSRIINSYSDAVVRYKTEAFAEKITYVDSGFFKMFSFKVITGNFNLPFEDNLSAVLTKSTAAKYFKNEDPIGKLILIDSDGEKLYKISAVVDDPPDNSSIDFKILVPVESWVYYMEYSTQWNEYTYSFFVLLKEGASEKLFSQKLNRLVVLTMKDHIAVLRDIMAVPSTITTVFYLSLTKLPFVHWNTRIPWSGTNSHQNIYILSGIAAIIIIISCINFISIALTRSISRGKEVGIRKVNGANRKHLFIQFILESFGHTIIASLIGLTALAFLLTKFNFIIGKDITFDFSFFDIIAFLLLILVVVVLNSLYPALIISSFSPVVILKSKFNYRIKTGLVSGLVVLQFALSIFFSICSLVMVNQIKYINTKDLGYDRVNIMCIPTYSTREDANLTLERIKQKTLQMPGVISVAGVSRSFFKGMSSMGYINSANEQSSAKVYSVDQDYVETLGLKIISGRNFDVNRKSDDRSILINETLARSLPGDALNQYIRWGQRGDSSEVIGIVKDFHFRTLEHYIEPLFLTMNYSSAGPLQTVLIRFSGDIPEKIIQLKKIWNDVNPGKPFDVAFLDDDINKQYESYQQWNQIISISTIFALVIACVGLFGLAGLNTVRRYHEIGVRKTLGASILDLAMLLNIRYLGIICISFFIAVPFAFLVMNDWLDNFAFQVPFDWVIYLEILLIFTFLALFTISYHTIKGARINPSETLRYE